MRSDIGLITILPLLVFPAACASVQPPKPDPVKEEITTLRKQPLVLQKLQLETLDRLEKTAVAVETLSARFRNVRGEQLPVLADVRKRPA